jgi:hypothetical protein
MAVKRLKLMALLVMLSLILACLVSTPVFSGENPWDSDGGSGDDGPDRQGDSTLNNGDGGNGFTFAPRTWTGMESFRFGSAVFYMSYAFSAWVTERLAVAPAAVEVRMHKVKGVVSPRVAN